MNITYKYLNSLNYPVFRLPSDNWGSRDGLLRVDGLIVDDKNMPGETLGKRRLQTPFRDLLKLKWAYMNPLALIKEKSGPYIDNTGRVFIYEKTKFCKLDYYKIRKIDKRGHYSLLWLHGINFPTEIPRPPGPEFRWAGLLHLNDAPWMLYEYSKIRLPKSRKKV